MTDLATRLKSYAGTAPLDRLGAGQIQKDLMAIAGDPHAYRRPIGSTDCLLCGQGRDAAVHNSNCALRSA